MSAEKTAMNTISSFANTTGPVTQEEIARFKNHISNQSVQTDNSQGTLAWKESWQLIAFVEMYEATGETFFLDQLVEHADQVWKFRDDKHGKLDAIRQHVMPSWGSSVYSGGQWHVWLVHSGILTYPMASFVCLVYENGELHAQYRSKAEEYFSRIQEVIDGFNSEWVQSGDEGYYQYPDGLLKVLQPDNENPLPQHPLPINQYLALGLSMLELGCAADCVRAGSGGQDLERAERMARFTRKQLQPGAKPDTYTWNYGFGRVAFMEDFSHGALLVMFAALAQRHGIVFTEADLQILANTFNSIVIQPDGRPSLRIDGTGGSDDNMDLATGLWLDLAGVDRAIYDHCYEMIVRRGKDIQQLGYARILKWKHRLADSQPQHNDQADPPKSVL